MKDRAVYGLGILFAGLFAILAVMSLPRASPERNRERLLRAELYDDAETAAALLRNGADPNTKDDTGYPVLLEAISHHHPRVARVLIGAHADVNLPSSGSIGFYPLTLACYWGEYDIVATLIAHGAHVNGNLGEKATPLIAAARAGNIQVIRLLLEKGADPNVKFSDGRSASSIAEQRVEALTEGPTRQRYRDILALLKAAKKHDKQSSTP